MASMERALPSIVRSFGVVARRVAREEVTCLEERNILFSSVRGVKHLPVLT